MSYIGNTPAENYASFLTETFSVSATANYTLSHAVSNENDIRLVINNVVQQPGSGKAYTASGTTLTLTSATASGDVMYAVYLGRALQTVNPPNASVGNSQTAPTIITGQTAETSIATDDTILIHDTSASALRKMTRANFVSGIGGANTPAFQVLLSSAQTIPNTTDTKVTVSHELFDTDNAFASNRFTVPSGKGGSYLFNFGVQPDAWSFGRFIIYMYKNNSKYAYVEMADDDNSPSNNRSLNSSTYMQLSDGDYIEMYVYQNNGSAQTIRGATNEILTYFGGHRLIT